MYIYNPESGGSGGFLNSHQLSALLHENSALRMKMLKRNSEELAVPVPDAADVAPTNVASTGAFSDATDAGAADSASHRRSRPITGTEP